MNREGDLEVGNNAETQAKEYASEVTNSLQKQLQQSRKDWHKKQSEDPAATNPPGLEILTVDYVGDPKVGNQITLRTVVVNNQSKLGDKATIRLKLGDGVVGTKNVDLGFVSTKIVNFTTTLNEAGELPVTVNEKKMGILKVDSNKPDIQVTDVHYQKNPISAEDTAWIVIEVDNQGSAVRLVLNFEMARIK